MSVVTDAYRGFSVSGFTPTHAPNPSCCSNARVLCPSCAALALATQGSGADPLRNVSNALTINEGCPDCENCDDDMLMLPVWNWAKEKPEADATADDDDADLLPLPTINWK